MGHSDFFRLDAGNTQHFYEDIGKYNKYIFGWADWYHTFATDATGTYVLDQEGYQNAWKWTSGQAHEIRWEGNAAIASYDPNSTNNIYILPGSPVASPMRRKYIQMRQDAEDDYNLARAFGFGLALNHVLSGIDAIRVTNKRNRYFLSDSGFRFQYYADLNNDNFTPRLSLSYKF